MAKNNNEIELHRPAWRSGGAAPRFGAAQAMRAQLLREIYEIEARLGRAKASGTAIDRAIVASCDEMIRSRRVFYRQLDS